MTRLLLVLLTARSVLAQSPPLPDNRLAQMPAALHDSAAAVLQETDEARRGQLARQPGIAAGLSRTLLEQEPSDRRRREIVTRIGSSNTLEVRQTLERLIASDPDPPTLKVSFFDPDLQLLYDHTLHKWTYPPRRTAPALGCGRAATSCPAPKSAGALRRRHGLERCRL